MTPRHLFAEVEVGDALPVQVRDAVTGQQAGQLGGAACGKAVQHEGDAEVGKAYAVGQQAVHQAVGDIDRSLLAVAQDGDLAGVHNAHQQVGSHALERLAVGRDEHVSILEAHLVHRLVEVHAQRGFLYGDVRVAPGKKYHRVDEQGQEEVEQYAAHHDEQALPGGLRAEFPRLGRLFHLLQVHGFVYHATDFDVSAQRQPADGVFRLTAFGLELEEREPGVEEQAELFHPRLEQPGKEEVPHLVNNHQERKAQDELEGTD